MENGKFNIRVYGILLDEGRVLVTDEFRLGINMTKFPGGGLQYGEGIVDCLRREFTEELDLELTEISHYYTTEEFVKSKLLPNDTQLISIYYKVKGKKPFTFAITDKIYDFPEIIDGAQSFRWISSKELDPAMFTFPIDKLIAEKLKKELNA